MQNFVFMARMSRGLSDDTINLLFILSFIVAIAVYFIFLNPSNENKFSGFLKWLYNFLSFRFLFLDVALKIIYITSVIITVLTSFYVMFNVTLGYGLGLLLGGLIGTRLVFEALLLGLTLVKNTTDIRKKLIDPENFNKDKINDEFTAFDNIKNKVTQKVQQNTSASAKICPNCNAKNSSDSGFCGNCGSPLK